MGPIAQNMEACRDARRVNVIEHAIWDLRFALRQLVKSPGFACTAVFVLSLGIAANVAIFGFVEATYDVRNGFTLRASDGPLGLASYIPARRSSRVVTPGS